MENIWRRAAGFPPGNCLTRHADSLRHRFKRPATASSQKDQILIQPEGASGRLRLSIIHDCSVVRPRASDNQPVVTFFVRFR